MAMSDWRQLDEGMRASKPDRVLSRGVPFETTRWSLIVAAGSADSSAARDALATLCETYWYPLYAYVRSRGNSADDARDLTQGFLTSLLERRDFERVDQAHGRFRAFLLASLQHFLANDAARRRTQKRGSGVTLVPLDLDTAEGRYRIEPQDTATPETLYERRWALLVIERVLARLRRDWQATGRPTEFDELKACLLGQHPVGGYTAAATRLGTTEGALKTAVHRLRRKFQQALRQDIAETVSDPADIDDEIRYLVRALSAQR
jgi:DNA-directed RNA polymerase specialized sigma24 family protein